MNASHFTDFKFFVLLFTPYEAQTKCFTELNMSLLKPKMILCFFFYFVKASRYLFNVCNAGILIKTILKPPCLDVYILYKQTVL